jgi:hypothetical protein
MLHIQLDVNHLKQTLALVIVKLKYMHATTKASSQNKVMDSNTSTIQTTKVLVNVFNAGVSHIDCTACHVL